jgi:hypothetical protein
MDEIIGEHQFGFQCNRTTTDQIIWIWQILEKSWKNNETVHQLFVDFKKLMFQLGGKYCTTFS